MNDLYTDNERIEIAKNLDSYLKKLDLCKFTVHEYDNIYADMLINLFEERPGLFIRF